MAFHFKHELPNGVLTIDSIAKADIPDIPSGPDDISENNLSPIVFKFECTLTGLRFETSSTYSQLCALCPLFAVDGELYDSLGEPPIVIAENNYAMIRYIISGKKRKYTVDIRLEPSKYLLSRDEIIGLCEENAQLRQLLLKSESKTPTHHGDENKIRDATARLKTIEESVMHALERRTAIEMEIRTANEQLIALKAKIGDASSTLASKTGFMEAARLCETLFGGK